MSTRGWLGAGLLGWGVLTAFRGAYLVGAEWSWVFGDAPADMYEFGTYLNTRTLAQGVLLLLFGVLTAATAPWIARRLFGDHDTPVSRSSLGLVSITLASVAVLVGCVAILGPSLAIQPELPSLSFGIIEWPHPPEPRYTGTWVLAAVALLTALTTSVVVRRRGDALLAPVKGTWPAVRHLALCAAGVVGIGWAIARALKITAAQLFAGRHFGEIREVPIPAVITTALVGVVAFLLLRTQRTRIDHEAGSSEQDPLPTRGQVHHGVWSCVGAYALLVAAATLLFELAGVIGLFDRGHGIEAGDGRAWWRLCGWMLLGAIAWMGLRRCVRLVRGLPHRPQPLDMAPLARASFEPLLWGGMAAWTIVEVVRHALAAILDGIWTASHDTTYEWALHGAAAVQVAILVALAWLRGWRGERTRFLAVELGAAIAWILAVPDAARAISEAMAHGWRPETAPSWTAARVAEALMHVAVPFAVIAASRWAARRPRQMA